MVTEAGCADRRRAWAWDCKVALRHNLAPARRSGRFRYRCPPRNAYRVRQLACGQCDALCGCDRTIVNREGKTLSHFAAKLVKKLH